MKTLCKISKIDKFKNEKGSFCELSIVDTYSSYPIDTLTFLDEKLDNNTLFELDINLNHLDNWGIKSNVFSILIYTDKKLTKEDIDNHFEKWKLENSEFEGYENFVIFDYLIDRQREKGEHAYLVRGYKTYKQKGIRWDLKQ